MGVAAQVRVVAGVRVAGGCVAAQVRVTRHRRLGWRNSRLGWRHGRLGGGVAGWARVGRGGGGGERAVQVSRRRLGWRRRLGGRRRCEGGGKGL